jgi:hypothetical protein
MGLSINNYHVPDLPKLAWLVCLDQKIFTELSVFYGSSVECRKTWMVEGVWDGDCLLQKVLFRAFRPKIKCRRSTAFWPNLDVSFLMWIWVAHLLSERMGRELHNCVEVLSDAKEKLGLEAIHRGVSMRMKLPLYN